MELPKSTAEPEYENWGICSFCLLSLEAIPPHGDKRRHKSTQVPFGECEQAKKQAADKKKDL